MLRERLLERVFLPLTGALTPFTTQRHLREMLDADRAPLSDQVAERERRLAALLAHAARETALYAERLPRGGYDELARAEAFATVPITRKEDLRAGFPDRQLARSHRRGWLRTSNTSGTSGRALLLLQDVDDVSAKYASILRSRALAGVSLFGAQARLTPNECQPARRRDGGAGRGQELFVHLERRLIQPVIQRRLMLGPLWEGDAPTAPVDLDRVLDRVERFDPEVLTLYPPYAMMLAAHLRRRGRPPPTRRGIVDFSAGLATPSMRARIEEAFGRPTAQGCGGCEFARYGASCREDPDRMHLAETYCYVETLRPDGAPCAPGELGNVVVTSLHGRAMPLLRLEPGDVARILEEPCACGRRSRRIEHHGRVHSVLQIEDGRWVTGREVWDRLFRVPGVGLFELTQRDRARYRLRVLVEPDATLDRPALDDALGELLGASAEVEVERVPALRTQASGKLMMVRSATYERFRVPSARGRDVPIN